MKLRNSFFLLASRVEQMQEYYYNMRLYTGKTINIEHLLS